MNNIIGEKESWWVERPNESLNITDLHLGARSTSHKLNLAPNSSTESVLIRQTFVVKSQERRICSVSFWKIDELHANERKSLIKRIKSYSSGKEQKLPC